MTETDHKPGNEGGLDPSEIHNVLRNDRRRRAIEHLRESDEPMSVNVLAEHIATVETGESPPPRDVRKSVYVSLHQTHLPKLDDLDIIEYDQRDQMLELRERAREVEAYMETNRNGTPWPTYYLGISVFGVGALLAVQFDLAVVSTLGVGFWAWAILTLFGVSSLYHAYEDRIDELLWA